MSKTAKSDTDQQQFWQMAIETWRSSGLSIRNFCGKDTHPYELYLALNEIEHRTPKVKRPQTNGFVERFNRTVLDEFFRPTFRTRLYTSIGPPQKDLDQWRKEYNEERPHQGYQNRGKRPIDTVKKFIKIVRKED
jgi:transposase InsO family protein